MTTEKKKAPGEQQLIEGSNRIKTLDKGTETMNTSISEFKSKFDISTKHARIYIETDDDYCEKYGITNEQRVFDTTGMIRVDTGSEVLFLGAAEALSVAAALQAVAVHLMEEKAAA